LAKYDKKFVKGILFLYRSMTGVLANEKVIVQYLEQIPSDPTSVAARITGEMTNLVSKIGQDSPPFR